MAPATISMGRLPALAIVISTIPMVPTVPSDVPSNILTQDVIKNAQIMKRFGLINSIPDAIIMGIIPDACHMAMSQPMSKKICITTIEVLALVQDMRSKSFGLYPCRYRA